MYNSDHTATECIGQKKFFFLLPPQSVDVLSRFIYTALWLKPKKKFGGKVQKIYWTLPFSLRQILFCFISTVNEIFRITTILQLLISN